MMFFLGAAVGVLIIAMIADRIAGRIWPIERVSPQCNTSPVPETPKRSRRD